MLVAACGSSSDRERPDRAPARAASQDTAAANSQGLAVRQRACAPTASRTSPTRQQRQGGIQIQQSQRSATGATTSVNGVPVNGPAFQSRDEGLPGLTCPNGGVPSAAQTAKLRGQGARDGALHALARRPQLPRSAVPDRAGRRRRRPDRRHGCGSTRTRPRSRPPRRSAARSSAARRRCWRSPPVSARSPG